MSYEFSWFVLSGGLRADCVKYGFKDCKTGWNFNV